MRCEICGKLAPVHVTEIRGGKSVQGHYCELHAGAIPRSGPAASGSRRWTQYCEESPVPTATGGVFVSIIRKLNGLFQRHHRVTPALCEDCSTPATLTLTEVGHNGMVGQHHYCDAHIPSSFIPSCQTSVVRVVDAETGGLLPIKVGQLYGLFEFEINDQLCVWRITRRTSDGVEITYNVCLSFTATSDGFEKKVVQLTAASPRLVIVPLLRLSE